MRVKRNGEYLVGVRGLSFRIFRPLLVLLLLLVFVSTSTKMPGNILILDPAVVASWPAPNYVDPPERTWLPLACGITYGLSTLTVSFRLWLRMGKQGGGFGLDDVSFSIVRRSPARCFNRDMLIHTGNARIGLAGLDSHHSRRDHQRRRISSGPPRLGHTNPLL